MKQGDNYIGASKVADELFYEEVKLFGYEKAVKSMKNCIKNGATI